MTPKHRIARSHSDCRTTIIVISRLLSIIIISETNFVTKTDGSTLESEVPDFEIGASVPCKINVDKSTKLRNDRPFGSFHCKVSS